MAALPTALTLRIFDQAHELGFDLVGSAPIAPPPTAHAYQEWVALGFHGEMAYLARTDAIAKRADPQRILPGARSVLSVAMNYHVEPVSPALEADPSRGQFSAYSASGGDYHYVLGSRLERLAQFVALEAGSGAVSRAYVDTGPILERAWAARAGLGFVGNNTLLIHPRLGSWLFLGEILTTLEVAGPSCSASPQLAARAGASPTPPSCGRCTRCLDMCPTRALVSPRQLDARRCISYLTIELRGVIPRALRAQLHNRVFGCDVCQRVCPWNIRFARPSAEPAFRPLAAARAPRLVDLLCLDGDSFRRQFAGSPVLRARRAGLLRNVAVALGNWGDPSVVPHLAAALHDPEALVRGHAAWALGRIGSADAQAALSRALCAEDEPWVREELQLAIR